VTNILEIANLTIRNKSGTELLRNISFGLKQSKVNVLVGESGSGKSLTAKALVQSIPSTLEMHFDRLCYKNESVTDLRSLLGKDIGFISQDYTHSFNDHTKLGKQLVSIYRMHYKVEKSVAKQFVSQALQWVDLNPNQVMQRYRFSLSGGQLARVQIASVLMLNPEIVIADEPTSSLDVITGYNIMHLIKHLAEIHQVTLLIITHNLSHVLNFSDWINVIQHGEVIDSHHVDVFKDNKVKPYSLKLFNSRSQLRKGGSYD